MAGLVILGYILFLIVVILVGTGFIASIVANRYRDEED